MSDTEETGIFKDYASQKRPCVKGFACIENLNLGFVYLIAELVTSVGGNIILSFRK